MKSSQKITVSLIKNSCQVAPKAIPKEIIASLKRLPCHHFSVNDLNTFINKKLALPPEQCKLIGNQTYRLEN